MLQSLTANARTAWRRRASPSDFVRRMMWTYAGRLPSMLAPRDWTIAFRYPPPVGSLRLCLRSNDGADAFTHSEVFEHQYYRLPFCRAPSTILDIGANIGLSAIYFAKLFPNSRLACVEPGPENLQILRRNLKLNGVDAIVISAAIDSRDGMVMMERGARDYGHRIADESSPPASLFQATASSMGSILRRTGWSRIGLLKMDIEGHEKNLLLRDCEWLHNVDSFCLEYHHHSAEADLARIADRYEFLAPRRLPGNIWLLSRSSEC